MSGSRTRTVDFEDPEALVDSARGRLGIDVLRDLCTGRAPAAPIQVTLGFDLLEVQDGFARFQSTPGEHLYGATGTVHSGVVATLLDAAMAAAVMTTLDAVTSYTTTNLNVHVTRSISIRTGRILVEGWVVHRGSRLVTAEARLNDEQNRLLAHGTGTYSLGER
jgi:uncharacterized protein (TIGR00369 family)